MPGIILALITFHMMMIWYQKHTQFAGPGRTEDNVVGSRLFPAYAAKAGGFFFLVFAVLAALGGLAQINPIWLYGPYDPSQVTAGSQPDWYVGGWTARLAPDAEPGDPRVRAHHPAEHPAAGRGHARHHLHAAARLPVARGPLHR